MGIWTNSRSIDLDYWWNCFLIVLGLILRLVGIEYDLQKQEAAYRKILVIAEDDGNVDQNNMNYLMMFVKFIFKLSKISIF